MMNISAAQMQDNIHDDTLDTLRLTLAENLRNEILRARMQETMSMRAIGDELVNGRIEEIAMQELNTFTRHMDTLSETTAVVDDTTASISTGNAGLTTNSIVEQLNRFQDTFNFSPQDVNTFTIRDPAPWGIAPSIDTTTGSNTWRINTIPYYDQSSIHSSAEEDCKVTSEELLNETKYLSSIIESTIGSDQLNTLNIGPIDNIRIRIAEILSEQCPFQLKPNMVTSKFFVKASPSTIYRSGLNGDATALYKYQVIATLVLVESIYRNLHDIPTRILNELLRCTKKIRLFEIKEMEE